MTQPYFILIYTSTNYKMLSLLNLNELEEVSNWFKCNKLSLNAAKTNLMFLGTAHQTSKMINNAFNIYLDSCKLTRVLNAKFLGLTTDENLNWKDHITAIRKTCSRNLGVLKVKHFLPRNLLYKLYLSRVQPYLSYGILLWGNANKKYLDQIHKLQKRSEQ